MFNGLFKVPQPVNEPVKSYAPGTPDRAALKAALKDMLGQEYEVPMIIALLIPVLLARSMGMQTIVAAQNPWYIFVIPLAAVILFIS